MKQLKLNIEREEKIVNKKIKEEFSLKNATLYGGYNLFSDYLASNGLDRLLEEELGGMKAPWAVAVGTILSDGPSHRSQRALLTHWAPTSGVWRQSAHLDKDV